LIEICLAGHSVVHGIDLRAQIDGDDIRTLLSKADGVAPSLSTGSAGDESDLAFYSISHAATPPL